MEGKIAPQHMNTKNGEDLFKQGNKAIETYNRVERNGKTGEETIKKSLEEMTREELLERVKEITATSERYSDLYLRSQADMENLKKRHKKEKEDWMRFSTETLIKDLLPTMDNLEKAVLHSENEKACQSIKAGVELTLKGFKETLNRSGLEEVNALTQSFDPCFHEAVSEMEDEKMPAGMVLHELQKGYILQKRLIRPAKVIVSKGKSGHRPEKD